MFGPSCPCSCQCHSFRSGRCGIAACCGNSGQRWHAGNFLEFGEEPPGDLPEVADTEETTPATEAEPPKQS